MKPKPTPQADPDGAIREAIVLAVEGLRSADDAPTRIAIAYSGGADSTALLHVASALHRDGALDVVALHVHHGIAAAADDWLDHCREQAAAFGVAFDAAHVVLPRRAASLEAEARTLRYQVLSTLCRQHGCTMLMTAHHADDQAETVLLNLARGAGIGGLAATARTRRIDRLLVVRPLLDLPAALLRAHVAAHGLPHVEDPSNDDRRFTRNAIRHEVMPAFRRIVPTVAARLARTAAHASTVQGLLDDIGREDLLGDRGDPDLAGTTAEAATLDVERLATLSEARAANALRVWLAQRGLRAPSAAALTEMLEQLLHASPDAQIALLHERHTLRLYRGRVSVDRAGPPRAGVTVLRWQGRACIEVPEWHGVLHFDATDGRGFHRTLLDEGDLILRARRGGERLQMRIDGPSRTLKNLYQEAGIAAWRRPRLPLVYRDERLLFAAGLGANAAATVDSPPDAETIALRWEALG